MQYSLHEPIFGCFFPFGWLSNVGFIFLGCCAEKFGNFGKLAKGSQLSRPLVFRNQESLVALLLLIE